MRQSWMKILAKAPFEKLEAAWSEWAPKPDYRHLRQPETGLVMVRGRAEGKGLRFNLGEMTLTRSTIQINHGAIGCAYVMGRNKRHAELAAVFDALLQDSELWSRLNEKLIAPLEIFYREQEEGASRKTATSKVEFFTMARGE